jgi:hypothetical protein
MGATCCIYVHAACLLLFANTKGERTPWQDADSLVSRTTNTPSTETTFHLERDIKMLLSHERGHGFCKQQLT